MKPIVVFISLYFMLLAVLPCHCNSVSFGDFSNNEISTIGCLHSDNDTDHDLDFCTPFCSCSGIHYPNFVAQNKIKIQAIESLALETFPIYQENNTATIVGSLWRPPQV